MPADTLVNSTTLDLLSSPYLILTLGSNSFTLTDIISDESSAPNARTIDLLGVISGPGFDSTQARFLLQFNQAGGANTTISYAGTVTAIGAVPEPSTFILAGLGGLGFVAFVRRNRLQAA